jgi:hypothetical protein
MYPFLQPHAVSRVKLLAALRHGRHLTVCGASVMDYQNGLSNLDA